MELSPSVPSPATTPDPRHAVVIGASMMGLLAARVLCDHFERVTLIERDHLPDMPTPRNGVPQARHIHVLLVRGRQILDQLFPGLAQVIIDNGAVTLDTAADFARLAPGGWAPRFTSSLLTISVSRDRLEWHVRQRLLSHPRVSVLQQHDAVGFVTAGGGQRILGVRGRASGEQHSTQDVLAGVVVDASGRSSHAAEWLTQLGYPSVETTTVNAFLGYASRIFAIPANARYDWKGLLMQARAPKHFRAGALLPIEGNRWIVTVAGYGRDYPSTHEEGFMEFARSLPGPEIYKAIREAELLSPISGYQRTENQLRYYERLARFPENLFILGDAACAFNPVYGQGMTSAALSAMTLDQELRAGQAGAGARFQKHLAAQNQSLWLIATTVDYQFPTTEGPKPDLTARLSQWYMNRSVDAVVGNPRVFQEFLAVTHLVTPPTALFRPSIVAPVMRQTLARARNPRPQE